MKINKVHCLFEQSGTFKNEFIKLGIPAEDYDIQNEFGETDHIIDIFENTVSHQSFGIADLYGFTADFRSFRIIIPVSEQKNACAYTCSKKKNSREYYTNNLFQNITS